MSFHAAEMKILETLSGETVLELGAGYGYTAKQMTELYAMPVGIEPDISVILDSDVQKQYLENGKFMLAAAHGDGLPFENNAFDGVISHWSLHHYCFPLCVLLEACRIIKKEGWLYLADGIEYDGKSVSPRQRNHLRFHDIAVAIDRLRHRDHFPLKKPDEIAELIGKAGFKVESMKVVLMENAIDLECEREYATHYMRRLTALKEKAENMGAPRELSCRVDKLISSISNEGIRLGPFVEFVCSKS